MLINTLFVPLLLFVLLLLALFFAFINNEFLVHFGTFMLLFSQGKFSSSRMADPLSMCSVRLLMDVSQITFRSSGLHCHINVREWFLFILSLNLLTHYAKVVSFALSLHFFDFEYLLF